MEIAVSSQAKHQKKRNKRVMSFTFSQTQIRFSLQLLALCYCPLASERLHLSTVLLQDCPIEDHVGDLQRNIRVKGWKGSLGGAMKRHALDKK